MEFGLFLGATDYSMHPVELAREAEARGFDYLLFPEHSHIPASRQTPFPGGGELHQDYYHLVDPFVALGMAAAATSTIRLGTGICLVIQRDPITLAKSVASIDHLSGGRFMLGIGGGWNREEMENHGTDYTRRWTRMRETVEAMREIWSRDEASYHGEFINFDAIWSWPKPVQRPGPPVIVGGNGERTLQRVVRYGDAWMPLYRGDAHFLERIPELNEMAAKAGRGTIPVRVFNGSTRPEILERFLTEGIAAVDFAIPADNRELALKRLDRLEEALRPFRSGAA